MGIALVAQTLETGAKTMKLLTQANRKALPPLYAQESLGDQSIVYVKFFTPDSNWTWYATEFDGDDIFFGMVDGMDREYGYFTLHELTKNRGPLGLAIERDMHWTPKTLAEINGKAMVS